MTLPDRQERCETLLREGLAEVSAAVLALAATQPELALEAYCVLGQAVHPYLRGDRRAARILARLRQAERLVREP